MSDGFPLEFELKAWLIKAGASLVGFADMEGLSSPSLPVGISVAVALDPKIMAGLGDGPTQLYRDEYDRKNEALAKIAIEASAFLRRRGFKAESGPATVRVVKKGQDTTPLPHKTVATRAGLGWIGNCALLITPEFGSAVRLNSIFTNAPITCADPIVTSQCGTCRQCLDACPAGAVKGGLWEAGLAREVLFDATACLEKATELALSQGIDVTLCGICIQACPWTQTYLKRSGLG